MGKGGLMKVKSRRSSGLEEEVLHQQAIALLQETAKAYSQTYRRSSSSRAPSSKQSLPRSASARPRAIGDPLLQPQQLLSKVKENTVSESVERNKFVLIHGGGFGAWCWYKSIALLEEAGFITTALDLSGSGIDPTNPNEITSLEQYSKPLFDYLENLPDHEKVNLVGHSFGGACISYAMERYPKKIAKAIFVAATMVKNEQSAFDVFFPEVTASNELVLNAQVFVYANGKGTSPTSMELDKNQMKEIFFNRTSSKDVALAIVSVRPVPFGPVLEKLLLTEENYGSVRRFFIQTMDDQIFTIAMQERMINLNPPEQVLKLKGSDHCPFFSKPQSLHALFMEIAQLEAKKRDHISQPQPNDCL